MPGKTGETTVPFSKRWNKKSSDEQLAAQAVNGDHEALGKLLERHQGWFYNIALRMVGLPQEAEDVTQEVMLKIFIHLPGFKGRSKFRTWAYRIMVNHVLNMKRRGMETEEVYSSFRRYAEDIDKVPDMELPDQSILPVDLRLIVEELKIHCMMAMLSCLNRNQRMVFILGELFEVTDTIGAEIMEISKENFRQTLSRGRRKVYGFMKACCGCVDPCNSCHCERKTKALLDNGVIKPTDLYFAGKSTRRIGSLLQRKFSRFEDIRDLECRNLFQTQPFYDAPSLVESYRRVLDGRELKKVFNLET